MSKPGIVYILSNPSFKTNVVKIGMTTRTAKVRAWEIYVNATGVPTPFHIEHTTFCVNCEKAEKIVHDKLSDVRLNAFREFFSISISNAIKLIETTVSEINKSNPETKNNFQTYQVFLEVNAPSCPHPHSEINENEKTVTRVEIANIGSPGQTISNQKINVFSEQNNNEGKQVYKGLKKRPSFARILCSLFFFGIAITNGYWGLLGMGIHHNLFYGLIFILMMCFIPARIGISIWSGEI